MAVGGHGSSLCPCGFRKWRIREFLTTSWLWPCRTRGSDVPGKSMVVVAGRKGVWQEEEEEEEEPEAVLAEGEDQVVGATELGQGWEPPVRYVLNFR